MADERVTNEGVELDDDVLEDVSGGAFVDEVDTNNNNNNNNNPTLPAQDAS